MRKHSVYNFRKVDPMLIRLVTLIEASGVSASDLAHDSDLTTSQIYKMIGAVRHTGNRYYFPRTITIATMMRILIGLGKSISALEIERETQYHRFRVLSGGKR